MSTSGAGSVSALRKEIREAPLVRCPKTDSERVNSFGINPRCHIPPSEHAASEKLILTMVFILGRKSQQSRGMQSSGQRAKGGAKGGGHKCKAARGSSRRARDARRTVTFLFGLRRRPRGQQGPLQEARVCVAGRHVARHVARPYPPPWVWRQPGNFSATSPVGLLPPRCGIEERRPRA